MIFLKKNLKIVCRVVLTFPFFLFFQEVIALNLLDLLLQVLELFDRLLNKLNLNLSYTICLDIELLFYIFCEFIKRFYLVVIVIVGELAQIATNLRTLNIKLSVDCVNSLPHH